MNAKHDWRFVHSSVYIMEPGEWRVYNCARCGMYADAPLSPDLTDTQFRKAVAAIEPWLKGDKILPCINKERIRNGKSV